MTDKIFLRGHHLSVLSYDYFAGEDSVADLIYRKLSRDFQDNPGLLVEIVDGIDSVCMEAGADECPGFNASCVFPDSLWDEDVETLREYGFNVGETYCASDILERMIDYQNETGFVNPRRRFGRQNQKAEVKNEK